MLLTANRGRIRLTASRVTQDTCTEVISILRMKKYKYMDCKIKVFYQPALLHQFLCMHLRKLFSYS